MILLKSNATIFQMQTKCKKNRDLSQKKSFIRQKDKHLCIAPIYQTDFNFKKSIPNEIR